MKNAKFLELSPIRMIVLAFIFVGFAYVVSQVISGLLIYIGLSISGTEQSQINKTLQDSTFWQFAFMGIAMAVELWMFYIFVKFFDIKTEYLSLKKIKNDLWWYLPAGFLVYLLLSSVMMKVFSPFINEDQKQLVGFENVNGPVELSMVFLGLVILAPLAEEIIFRGYFYGELRRKIGWVVSAVLTSVFFGILHLQLGSGNAPLWAGLLDTFVLSMVLCYLREITGSIWYGVGIHSIKNFLAFILLFVLHINI